MDLVAVRRAAWLRVGSKRSGRAAVGRRPVADDQRRRPRWDPRPGRGRRSPRRGRRESWTEAGPGCAPWSDVAARSSCDPQRARRRGGPSAGRRATSRRVSARTRRIDADRPEPDRARRRGSPARSRPTGSIVRRWWPRAVDQPASDRPDRVRAEAPALRRRRRARCRCRRGGTADRSPRGPWIRPTTDAVGLDHPDRELVVARASSAASACGVGGLPPGVDGGVATGSPSKAAASAGVGRSEVDEPRRRAARSRRVDGSRGRSTGCRSPPADAALEVVGHLVEVAGERAGARGTSSRRRAAARRSSRDAICCASRAAATSTAPHDGPPKIPSRSTRSRSAAIASRLLTRYFASSIDGSRISGTNPSSSERRPWTCSPGSGSAATIRTPGFARRR